MEKKTKNVHLVLAGLMGCLFLNPPTSLHAQTKDNVEVADSAAIEVLRQKVASNMDSVTYHREFIKAMGADNPDLEQQYQLWMKAYPKNANIPFALGQALERQESPKAKEYLLKAVDIDPKLTEAWGGLWIDAERWGNDELGREYLRKATEADPTNANYAFYYASSFSKVDEEKYRDLSLKVADKFSDTERGAQSLYWLAVRSTDPAFKENMFKRLRQQFPPTKFRWSSSGEQEYFSFLFEQDRWEEALLLSKEMAAMPEGDDWEDNQATVEKSLAIKKALDNKEGERALHLIDDLEEVSRYSPLYKRIPIFKAEALAISGKGEEALGQLLSFYAKNPSPKLKKLLEKYGQQIGKTEANIQTDIEMALHEVAEPATPFELKNYEGGKNTLSDFKGKVVLLTYWFPGCGPCRGEFPHFQNVVSKFSKDQLAYVGINIVSKQNDYVLPFLAGTKYTFYPLEDVEGRDKGNLDNRGFAPMNFLIDKAGRVVFSDFRTTQKNEDELELMITELLELN
ncbi:redoxin domain-containing protein [Sphingobacterium gobiense]|uniref:Thioredoxin domain-containing protein n=1 Tax=Sphingobacterium gobiense TaxID=1382456 RepID=A0A2S9JTS9_9SPHI|nr:redoxin domain-containing protein [Sphingobacterium gobiense]PRD56697.1 hypothetical protein C5749_05555 [Sphingobacterium gobiense]